MSQLQLPQESTVSVGGKSYRLSVLSLNVLGEFLGWAKSQLPDPFADFSQRFGSCPESIQKLAFERASAIAERRGTVDDPECMAMMQTVPGVKKLVSLLFRRHHPDLTEDHVGEIIEQGIAEKGDGFLAGMFPADPKGVGKPSRKPK